MFLSRLATRRRQPEWMDQADLDPVLHQEALRGLARINRFSFSSGILWPAIRDLARQQTPHPLRVLDLACGAGDVALSLWQRAQRAKLQIDLTACDLSPVAIQFAAEQGARIKADVTFRELDVLNGELPEGFDVVTCSLFLHHLVEEDAVRLLAKMGAAARRLVLVNDLTRGRFGYLLAWFGTRLLSRSRVVHFDGPLSVEGAFTRAEALALANRAGLKDATIARRWPCRYLLRWSRP